MSTEKKSAASRKDPGRFSYLDELHLDGIERDLEAGKYVEPEALADALRKHGPHPIPRDVLDYICRMLEGQVPAPKGRKAQEEVEARRRTTLITGTYYRYFDWLEARRKKHGLPKGWTRGDPAPSEIAARLTARRLFGKKARWHSIRNMIRSRK